MAKNKLIVKYNNGNLAILCSSCRKIIKTGKDFTEEEMHACCGAQGDASKYLPPQYCKKCLISLFINYLFCRRDLNQRKAKKIWNDLKLYIPEKNIAEFEIAWNHYLIGELSYDDFAYYINLIKIKLLNEFGIIVKK